MNSEEDIKQELLSESSGDDIGTDFNDWRYQKAALRKSYVRRFALVQVTILLIYGAILAAVLLGKSGNSNGRDGEEFVYTPATSVDKFEPTMMNMHLYKDNPYKGPPNDALDDAWGKLFTNAYIRLSADELIQLNRTSTVIPDGSGQYFGALDVYHQLHCVRFIYKYVHKDYYTLRKINVPAPDHINHCIDVLRQVVMCLGDTSISTLSFHSDYPRAWPEFRFQHSCRNWDAVNSWAGLPGRHVDQSDHQRLEAWLANPNYIFTENNFDGHGEDFSDH